MIIGNGDIARAIPPDLHPEWIWFASGVSDSGETRESEFNREIKLLLRQDKLGPLIYFSTMAIYNDDQMASRYVIHKQLMETIVRREFDTWAIIRIGNITWGSNPLTLINALRWQAESGQRLDIRPVERFICTLDEFHYWLKRIRLGVDTNIVGRRMLVADIAREYVYGETVYAA